MSESAIVSIGKGAVFIIMAPLPSRTTAVATLVMPDSPRGKVDIRHCGSDHFVLLTMPDLELNQSGRARFASDALQHAWRGLVALELVSGRMPVPVEGDPRRML